MKKRDQKGKIYKIRGLSDHPPAPSAKGLSDRPLETFGRRSF